MADFTVPQNKDFTFTVKVMEKDSFLPQDLTNMDTANIEFTDIVTMCSIFSTPMTVTDALNGGLVSTLLAADTALLTVERGPGVDGYYPVVSHQALITITFTDTTPTIFTQITEVFVIPTGC